MADVQDHPKPSPEIEQLVLFGRIDEAVALYAKQAEVYDDTARAVIDALRRLDPRPSPAAARPTSRRPCRSARGR